MYLDALSFLEDERETWRPFEALAALTDDQLSARVEAAHGWSGRDLMGHLLGRLEISLAVAKELAVNEQSPTLNAWDARWEVDPDGVNAEVLAAFAALPMSELRERYATVPGELRGYLTVVPESRWIKHPTHQDSFLGETLDHYEEHAADLAAILAAVG